MNADDPAVAAWLRELDAAWEQFTPRQRELMRTAIPRAHATGDVQEAARWLTQELGMDGDL